MKVKRDIILKMQKEMAEHKDMVGVCYYCPVNVYKSLFDGTFLGNCARSNLKVLETLKLPHPPKNILDPDLGVECTEFFDWFLNLKVGKQRKAIKI